LENAGNSISKPLDFKIFRGSMPPDPPSGSRLRRLRAPPTYIALATAMRERHLFVGQEIVGIHRKKLKARRKSSILHWTRTLLSLRATLTAGTCDEK